MFKPRILLLLFFFFFRLPGLSSSGLWKRAKALGHAAIGLKEHELVNYSLEKMQDQKLQKQKYSSDRKDITK